MAQSWIRKYIPENPEDILGQDKAIAQLEAWLGSFKGHKLRGALLHGPPGSGKTSSVYALANKYNYEVVEVNASDFRNAAAIKERVGAAAGQMSLFGGSKIILVDEVDGLSGTKDRGGINEVVKLIGTSAFPIICTANDASHKKFKGLRKSCVMVDFDPPGVAVAFTVLKNICEQEKVQYEEQALKSLVRKTGGDMRAAINDLQGVSLMVDAITVDAIKELDERNKLDTIENALIKVFKNSDPMIALRAFDNIPEDLDAVATWIDYNAGREYKKPEDLVRAYDCISKADIYKGRIRRWQHWRFLVYINTLLSAGVAVAKDAKYPGMQPFKRSSRPLMIWMANMKYAKRSKIAEKIAEHTHTSTRRVIQTTIPYLQFIFKNNGELSNQLTEEFRLDSDEVEWLKK